MTKNNDDEIPTPALVGWPVEPFTSAQSAETPVTSPKLDSLAKLSQQFINANQPDSLYRLMGAAFKQQVSLDQLKRSDEPNE